MLLKAILVRHTVNFFHCYITLTDACKKQNMDYVIREAIIQYGETKKRKRYKLFKNTNLRELKDALTIQLGIQEY